MIKKPVLPPGIAGAHSLSPRPIPRPPPTYSVKMDDTPIPDYLIDMLKEAGEIDENGKPLNDFFDPDDDDEFGSKRIKEHNAEVEVRNRPATRTTGTPYGYSESLHICCRKYVCTGTCLYRK